MTPEMEGVHALTTLRLWSSPGEGQPTGRRRREPVSVGVPLPEGLVDDPSCLALVGPAGERVPTQARALDRWPGGSVRWALLDGQLDVHPDGETTYDLVARRAPGPAAPPPLTVSDDGGVVTVDTGVARAVLRVPGTRLLEEVTVDHRAAIDPDRSGLRIVDGDGREWAIRFESADIEACGPVRAEVSVRGMARPPRGPRWLRVAVRLHFFAGSAVARLEVALENPAAARHPGGKWTLGDRGSVHLRDVAFTVAMPGPPQQATVWWSAERGARLETAEGPLEIYQDSSGGANWRSRNHVNRHGRIPVRFQGYRVRTGVSERTGHRATPVVGVTGGGGQVAVAMRHFWENFPKAVEAGAGAVTLRLFPAQFADTHELQAGERKTHEFAVALGPDPVTDVPLDWCRQPSLACVDPAWACDSGAVPWLTPASANPSARYLALVGSAIDGDQAFARKREVIDEYGWRHFGDLYADHEAVLHRGPDPLVSHYNNQYDAVAGMATQFLMTGDPRWHDALDELARHVTDIDIYHTDRDKSAYNGGLLWHTAHYVDAGTSTHRSFPDAPGVGGGGPSSEHDYAGGLMLHHFLTGSADSRDAVIGLARWVRDMDDGRLTVFRWLDRGPTGLASATRSPAYHGPGRGAAYSIATLLAAHRLTGERAYRDKADALVRRCIHPLDDLRALRLFDAERRWSYTVFLEVLGEYLREKAGRGERDRTYAYARASLLHYARWMARNERPYLDHAEQLEYPTETWVAQDLRKSDVLLLAALHASGEERSELVTRARFFFDYAVSTMSRSETRTLTRPVVLLLSHGYMRPWWDRHPDASLPPPADPPGDFGAPIPFVPQKTRALRRARHLATASALLVLLAGLSAFLLILR
jgi:hypothetical protein